MLSPILRLWGLTVALDAVIVTVTVPLQRASLQAASSGAPFTVILAYLAGNVALLGLVLYAMYANGQLLTKIFRPSQLCNKIRRRWEEVSTLCDTSSTASGESAAPR